VLDETPAPRTIVGGAIVLSAIVAYLLWKIAQQRRIRPVAPPVN